MSTNNTAAQITAFYNITTDKLHISNGGERMPDALYTAARAAGFSVWHGSKQLVSKWSTQAEDVVLNFGIEIEEDDTPDDTAGRVERFQGYAERGEKQADSAQDYIDRGDANTARRAANAARRVESGLSDAEHWQRRVAASIRHANYKEKPAVIARRIKGLEADLRKKEREADLNHNTAIMYNFRDFCKKNEAGEYLKTEAGKLILDREKMEEAHEPRRQWAQRWINHLNRRLQYERAFLEAVGGLPVDAKPLEIGGAINAGWQTRDGFSAISKLNTQSVEIIWRDWNNEEGRTKVPKTSIKAIMSRAEVEAAQESGSVYVYGAETALKIKVKAPKAPKAEAVETSEEEDNDTPEGMPAEVAEFESEAPEIDAITAAARRNQAERAAQLAALDTTKREAAARAVELRNERNGATVARQQVETTNELLARKMPGFYPTPQPLAERMTYAAGIYNDGTKRTVLEPSAGSGRLMDAARRQGADVVGVEKMLSLAELCRAAGFAVTCCDFLEVQPSDYPERFDAVIMNPPFENSQDIAHVQHAYKFLKPGARLVAIMGEGAFFRSDRAAVEFRAWLDEMGGYSEQLEGGTFGSSGTNVNTRIVEIEAPSAPAPAPTDEPTEEPEAETEGETMTETQQEPAAPTSEAPRGVAFAFRAERSYLLNALKTAARFISAKTSLPVLSCVHMKAQGDRVTITSTDLDAFAAVSIPATVEQEGATVMPAAALLEYLTLSPDAPAAVQVNDEARAAITVKRSRFESISLPAEDFPVMPETDEESAERFSVNAQEFAASLSKVLPFVSKPRAGSFALTGVQFLCGAGTLTMNATDTKRAASQTIQAQGEGDQPAELHEYKVLPAPYLKAILKECKDAQRVAFTFDSQSVSADFGAVTLRSRFISEQFPSVEKVAAGLKIAGSMTFERAELLNVAELARKVQKGFSEPRLTITPRGHYAELRAGNFDGIDELYITSDANAPELTLNAAFIVDILKTIPKPKKAKKGEHQPADVVTLQYQEDTTQPVILAGCILAVMLTGAAAQAAATAAQVEAVAPQAQAAEPTPEPAAPAPQVEAASVPDLEPHCNSWIITRRATAEVIGEFYDRANVEKFDPATCLIETAAQYLGRINAAIMQPAPELAAAEVHPRDRFALDHGHAAQRVEKLEAIADGLHDTAWHQRHEAHEREEASGEPADGHALRTCAENNDKQGQGYRDRAAILRRAAGMPEAPPPAPLPLKFDITGSPRVRFDDIEAARGDFSEADGYAERLRQRAAEYREQAEDERREARAVSGKDDAAALAYSNNATAYEERAAWLDERASAVLLMHSEAAQDAAPPTEEPPASDPPPAQDAPEVEPAPQVETEAPGATPEERTSAAPPALWDVEELPPIDGRTRTRRPRPARADAESDPAPIPAPKREDLPQTADLIRQHEPTKGGDVEGGGVWYIPRPRYGPSVFTSLYPQWKAGEATKRPTFPPQVWDAVRPEPPRLTPPCAATIGTRAGC